METCPQISSPPAPARTRGREPAFTDTCLHTAVGEMACPVLALSARGTVLFCNVTLAGLVGLPAPEVRARNWLRTFVAPCDRQAERVALRTCLGEGAPPAVRTVPIRVAGGGRRRVRWRDAPLRDATGAGVAVLRIGEVVTDRNEREDCLSAVLEAAPFGAATVDSSGRILHVNLRLQRDFGYTGDELLGQAVETLVPPRLRESHARLRVAYRRSPSIRVMGANRNLPALRKDGSEFPAEIGLSLVTGDPNGPVLVTIANISERRRLEKALERGNREIAKSETLATLGRMAAMIAHDLRNPLSSVKMSLQMLDDAVPDERGGDDAELRQIALDQVRYMDHILSDLLSYSRPSQLDLQWIELRTLLALSVALAQSQIRESRVDVSSWIQTGLPNVHGDDAKLRQVFSNLVLNAVQACRDTGSPRVRVSARLDLEQDDPQVCVEIEDNGPGIDPAGAEQLFEPFHTTRSQGTGLGLAIVRRFLDLHGASVSLHPRDGGGTCARVRLGLGPLTTGQPPAGAMTRSDP